MSPEADFPGEFRPGIPRICEVADVEGEIHRLSFAGWISVFWPTVPQHAEAVDLLLLAIARTAQRHALKDPPLWTPDAWSRASRELLAEGRLPVPAGFGRELTLHRLVRWIEPRSRSLAIGVHTGPPPETRTIEVLAEWFSRAAGAECVILTGAQPRPPLPAKVSFRSEAERVLFEAMNRDPGLSGLFEPNVKVITRFHTSPCVDFLWRDGKTIIEIDSYFTHGARIPFGNDRQRDYETLVSGYSTLRLLYDEVMRDCELALNKVRRVVTLRKENKL